MVNNIEETCYWCGKKATSKEHVPPKCLFPENKDIKDIYSKTFRKNLITVPSCDKHNLAKSNDDEYLMACLSAKVGNNGIAFIHTQTKVARTIKRNPRLFDILKEDIITIYNQHFPVSIVNIDNYRLLHSFEAISRALYFYEFKKPFNGICKIIPTFLGNYSGNKRWNMLCNFCESEANKESINWIEKGENPEIFKYKLGPEDELGCRLLKMTFYNSSNVYVSFANPKAVKTLNLKSNQEK